MPNIKLLGHRSYDTLPGYLKGFDVAVIPYRINDSVRLPRESGLLPAQVRRKAPSP